MPPRRSATVSLPPSTERYAVEAYVASGGMGEVFKAVDRTTGEPVAIKLLKVGVSPHEQARFRREVAVLADLRHPNIVRYVDHGVWSDGRSFLAMEWLEGEDLDARRKREPPGMSDSVEAVRRASAALAAVHARGVIHRDIKLSNLWLSDGRIHRVKLIDFGVVKLPEDDGFTTQPGAIVGTPHHMAPEQARNEPITPRSDVYSLGSVLFLLVTGRLVFPSEHLVALLGRLVLEEAPLASSLRPDVPPALEQLLARCLDRDPLARFADGGELSRALARVGEMNNEPPPPRSRSSVKVKAASEEASISATVTRPMPAARPSRPSSPSITRVLLGSSGRRLVAVVVASLEQGLLPKELSRALRVVLRPFDHLEPIRGERLVLVVGLTGSDGDEVFRAAQMASLVARLSPRARVALASGYVSEDTRGLSSDTLDRAAAVLEQAAPGEARVDREALLLLGTRFRVQEDARGALLLGEDEGTGRARYLLGRPTATVGRDGEFAALATIYLSMLGDAQPRSAVVTGQAGVGKSRLRYELLRWLRVQSPAPEILVCRGDPLSERGGVSCLGRALRGRVGILDGEDPAAQATKLQRFVSELRRCGYADPHAEAIWSDLLGVRGGEGEGPLRASLQDPAAMQGRMQGAYEALVRLDALRAPQVVVLEDFHQVDELTRRLLGWVLSIKGLGLCVFAFARPHASLPALPWGAAQIELGPLSSGDAAALVREALPGADEAQVEAIIERAGGNALFLEELIRHAAEGRVGLPLTVQALVQARLDSMEPLQRSVLRAASVLGRACWSEAIEALVGEPPDEALAWLVSQEFLSENEEGRFVGQREWVFRHSLVREAIYVSLLDRDRAKLHGLAARWLEIAGEEDLATLAWHVEQSGDQARASELYARATAQAQAAGHLDGVLTLAERGLACSSDGLLRGRFLVARARALSWLGLFAEAMEQAQQALESCPAGVALRADAARVLASTMRDQGRQGESAQVLASALEEGASWDEATRSMLLSEQARSLADLGDIAGGRGAAEQAAGLAARARVGSESAMLRAVDARFFVSAVAGDVAGQIDDCAEVVRLADAAGDVPLSIRARCNLGHCLNCVGRFEDAAEALLRAAEDSVRSRTTPLHGFALHNLGLTLARLGRFEEGVEHQQQARSLAEQMGHERLRTSSLQYEALTRSWRNPQSSGALALAREAYRAAERQPTQRVMAIRVLAAVQQRRGANDAALELLSEVGAIPSTAIDHEWGMLARLTQVEALLAVDEAREARAVLRRSVILLLELSHSLPPDSRGPFLERLDEHRRLLGLARALGVGLHHPPSFAI